MLDGAHLGQLRGGREHGHAYWLRLNEHHQRRRNRDRVTDAVATIARITTHTHTRKSITKVN